MYIHSCSYAEYLVEVAEQSLVVHLNFLGGLHNDHDPVGLGGRGFRCSHAENTAQCGCTQLNRIFVIYGSRQRQQ